MKRALATDIAIATGTRAVGDEKGNGKGGQGNEDSDKEGDGDQ